MAGIYRWRTQGFRKQLQREGAGQAGAHSAILRLPMKPPLCIFTLSFHSKNISVLCKADRRSAKSYTYTSAGHTPSTNPSQPAEARGISKHAAATNTLDPDP